MQGRAHANDINRNHRTREINEVEKRSRVVDPQQMAPNNLTFSILTGVSRFCES